MNQLRGLVLSLFPGIDLLGRAFEQEEWCVVRGPDLLWGQRIEDFRAMPAAFDGVIAGPPCQDFSKARRSPPTGKGVAALMEFARVVQESGPVWWLLENVPGVPNVTVDGYHTQRFNLSARECGSPQNRLRAFQFGSRDGKPLMIRRRDTGRPATQRCCVAREGEMSGRRQWADFCELQGLPRDFSLPGWSIGARYRAVGNGVPLPMGRVVARAIACWPFDPPTRVCVCQCGRPVQGKQVCATAACRKRMERARRGTILPP